jgi:hypothetical protein
MSKPWLSHYPQGVPAEIDPSRYRSIAHMADVSFDEFASRIAYIQMGKSITYGDLDRLSQAFGAWLQHRGGVRHDAERPSISDSALRRVTRRRYRGQYEPSLHGA